MLPLDTKKCLVFTSKTQHFQAPDSVSRSKEETAQYWCQWKGKGKPAEWLKAGANIGS